MSLITLARFKEIKGISSGTKDTEHQAFLDMATSYIQSYCGRNFVSGAPVSESFAGDRDFYYLREYPVSLVLALTVDGITSADYNIDKINGYIETTTGLDFTSKSFQSVKISYIGGYSTIPDDLQLATSSLADYYKDREYAPRQSTGVHNKDNVNVSDRLPHYIKATLDAYRVSLPD